MPQDIGVQLFHVGEIHAALLGEYGALLRASRQRLHHQRGGEAGSAQRAGLGVGGLGETGLPVGVELFTEDGEGAERRRKRRCAPTHQQAGGGHRHQDQHAEAGLDAAARMHDERERDEVEQEARIQLPFEGGALPPVRQGEQGRQREIDQAHRLEELGRVRAEKTRPEIERRQQHEQRGEQQAVEGQPAQRLPGERVFGGSSATHAGPRRACAALQ